MYPGSMRPMIGVILLSWSVMSAAATLYAWGMSTSRDWIDKSMVPPAATLCTSGSLDADKLDAWCTADGWPAPPRGADGQIDIYGFAAWLDSGTVRVTRQAMSLVVIALGAGTLISGACGVACVRGKAVS
jgi:hypothetical protein